MDKYAEIQSKITDCLNELRYFDEKFSPEELANSEEFRDFLNFQLFNVTQKSILTPIFEREADFYNHFFAIADEEKVTNDIKRIMRIFKIFYKMTDKQFIKTTLIPKGYSYDNFEKIATFFVKFLAGTLPPYTLTFQVRETLDKLMALLNLFRDAYKAKFIKKPLIFQFLSKDLQDLLYITFEALIEEPKNRHVDNFILIKGIINDLENNFKINPIKTRELLRAIERVLNRLNNIIITCQTTIQQTETSQTMRQNESEQDKIPETPQTEEQVKTSKLKQIIKYIESEFPKLTQPFKNLQEFADIFNDSASNFTVSYMPDVYKHFNIQAGKGIHKFKLLQKQLNPTLEF